MNLFDRLVNEALKNQPNLSILRPVVEKELLHHDILHILSQHDLLKELTFIGGTCLRVCYGGVRLSEDLDFTGGKNFSKQQLATLAPILTKNIAEKYGLSVLVTEPIKDSTNVDTWKIKIETKPAQKHLPAQRIHLDICRVPSYERQAMFLINPYGVDMGTQGLLVQAQSREEIYTDKLLAFALRPNRIKFRDLWDILWLYQQGIKPRLALVGKKLQDRHLTLAHFLTQYESRQNLITQSESLANEFVNEMQRFLPSSQLINKKNTQELWSFIGYLINEFHQALSKINHQ